MGSNEVGGFLLHGLVNQDLPIVHADALAPNPFNVRPSEDGVG